jgi:hypothetical protein
LKIGIKYQPTDQPGTLILINKIYLAQLKNLHKKVNKADEFINE